MPQVKLIARRIYRQINGVVDLEDLISTGLVGLIEAVDRFAPSRGLKLKTFADFRIRGAILDSLRDIDPLTRDERRLAKQLDGALQRLQAALQRAPTDDEVADELGIPVATCRAILTAQAAHTYSLDSQAHEDSRPLGDTVRAHQPSPEEQCIQADLLSLLDKVLVDLPPLEAQLLLMHYVEDVPVTAIARQSNAPTWQLRDTKRRALAAVRERLALLSVLPNTDPLQAPVF